MLVWSLVDVAAALNLARAGRSEVEVGLAAGIKSLTLPEWISLGVWFVLFEGLLIHHDISY